LQLTRINLKHVIEAKGDAAGGTTGKTYAKLEIAGDIEKTMTDITDLKLKLKKDPTKRRIKK